MAAILLDRGIPRRGAPCVRPVPGQPPSLEAIPKPGEHKVRPYGIFSAAICPGHCAPERSGVPLNIYRRLVVGAHLVCALPTAGTGPTGEGISPGKTVFTGPGSRPWAAPTKNRTRTVFRTPPFVGAAHGRDRSRLRHDSAGTTCGYKIRPYETAHTPVGAAAGRDTTPGQSLHQK